MPHMAQGDAAGATARSLPSAGYAVNAVASSVATALRAPDAVATIALWREQAVLEPRWLSLAARAAAVYGSWHTST